MKLQKEFNRFSIILIIIIIVEIYFICTQITGSYSIWIQNGLCTSIFLEDCDGRLVNVTGILSIKPAKGVNQTIIELNVKNWKVKYSFNNVIPIDLSGLNFNPKEQEDVNIIGRVHSNRECLTFSQLACPYADGERRLPTILDIQRIDATPPANSCEIVNEAMNAAKINFNNNNFCYLQSNNSHVCDDNYIIQDELIGERSLSVGFGTDLPNLLSSVKDEYLEQVDRDFLPIFTADEHIYAATGYGYNGLCIYKSSNVVFFLGISHNHCYTYFGYVIPKFANSIDELIKADYLDKMRMDKDSYYSHSHIFIEDDKIVLRRDLSCP